MSDRTKAGLLRFVRLMAIAALASLVMSWQNGSVDWRVALSTAGMAVTGAALKFLTWEEEAPPTPAPLAVNSALLWSPTPLSLTLTAGDTPWYPPSGSPARTPTSFTATHDDQTYSPPHG